MKRPDLLFYGAQKVRLDVLGDHLHAAERIALVVDDAFREYGFSSLSTTHSLLLHIAIVKEIVNILNDFILRLKKESEVDA